MVGSLKRTGTPRDSRAESQINKNWQTEEQTRAHCDPPTMSARDTEPGAWR